MRWREIVRDAHGGLAVVARGEDVLDDRAGGSDGVDDCGGVLLAPCAGGDEAGVAAAADGAAEVAFVDATVLGRADRSEVIIGVEDGVAKDKVGFAVEVGRAGFGDDFDSSAAGAGELGGVGVVVDADLLDGGGGDAGALHLYAVDDECDSAG